jgi:pimeloyl-ACP methyl ester carboxylesterase
MAVILVHGVPETAAVWDPLIDELAARGHHDVLCLSPPGFGAPIPGGFEATMRGYRDWLIGELSQIEAPVDLVGHDWGGAHAIGVAMARPDLLRSWVTDVIGVFEPDYVWHEYAQIFQTPGQAERQLEIMFGGSVQDRAERLTEVGIVDAAARKVAAGQGDEMARAIIALYRSAVQPVLAEAGRHLSNAAVRPGLAIVATEDHAVGSFDAHHRGAERAGARVAVLQGLGHWWMNEDPAQGADIVTAFWDSLQAD